MQDGQENMEEKITKTENKNTHQKERYFFYTDQWTGGYDGKPLIKEINIQLKKGEIHALLGENGAGKSTLMNLLTDNIRRTSGEILYNGEEILKSGAKFRSKIGYMPQQQGMYEQLSVFCIILRH